MIEQFVGPIGSGKSYHALERIYSHLQKGKYVIANFPLKFTAAMIKKGYADKFLYLPTEFLEDENGIAILSWLSDKYGFDEFKNPCMIVIDECGDLYPPDQVTSPTQKAWKQFFKKSRHYGYQDIIMIMQDRKEINRTILSCMEYEIVHRKANNIFPFKLLPFTIFIHVVFWKQSRTRLKSGSTIFVKKFAQLYNTHGFKGSIKNVEPLVDLSKYDFDVSFGNCRLSDGPGVGGQGGQAVGGPLPADTGPEEAVCGVCWTEELCPSCREGWTDETGQAYRG